nr:MAG: hypothetical protein [Culex rhabdovirus]
MSFVSMLKGKPGPSKRSPSTGHVPFQGRLDMSLTIFTDKPYSSMEEAFLHLIEVQDYISETRDLKGLYLGLIAVSILFSKCDARGSGVMYTMDLKDLVSLISTDSALASGPLRTFSYERTHDLRGKTALVRFRIDFEQSGLECESLLSVLLKRDKNKEVMSSSTSYLKLWRLKMIDYKRGTLFSLS